MAETDVFVAKESATFDYQGQPVFLTAGVTTVRRGHPILRSHAHLFEPLRIHYDYAPPEPKHARDDGPANPVRADHTGARSRSARA